jgi:tripartite-type tricarboxylate transporter receptor subunit TctC
MMHHAGLTDLTYEQFTPLALMNFDPAGLMVSADSPYKTAKDVLAAAKANPGKLKASGTGQGGIWHIALAGMLQSAGIAPANVPWVPSQGAAPAMQDLAAGGIDIVTCSIPEARAMIEAKKAVGLAVMDDKRNPIFPDVPTLKEATGSDWSVAAWRGIAAPKGLPADIATKLGTALKKVYDSKEYKDFMAGRGFGVVWKDAKAFEAFLAKSDADFGKLMKDLGLAK